MQRSASGRSSQESASGCPSCSWRPISARRLALASPFGRQRRKSPVGRIDDQRGSLGSDDLVATVVPELVVGDDATRRIVQAADLRIDQVAILAAILLLLVFRGFLVGEERLGSERGGPFQRGDRAVIPHPLEIRFAVGCSRRRPRLGCARRLGRCRLRGNRNRCQQRDCNHRRNTRRSEKSMAHMNLLFHLPVCLRRCPYMSSSTNSTHLNSNSCAFFSSRR